MSFHVAKIEGHEVVHHQASLYFIFVESNTMREQVKVSLGFRRESENQNRIPYMDIFILLDSFTFDSPGFGPFKCTIRKILLSFLICVLSFFERTFWKKVQSHFKDWVKKWVTYSIPVSSTAPTNELKSDRKISFW